VTRQFDGQGELIYLSATRVRLTATPPLPTEIDGEQLGKTPLYVEAVPRGALLLVPQEYQAAKETAEA
jgi:diacylglycerol kinase family enzyme